MNNEKLKNRIEKINSALSEKGIKSNLVIGDLVDGEHLNCIWYGGMVSSFEYNGFTFFVEARGEIRCNFTYEGDEFDFVDKCDNGSAYGEFGLKINDKILEQLEKDGNIYYGNNNWFEINMMNNDTKQFYDLCSMDNVFDDNVLDVFEQVGTGWLQGCIDQFTE